MAHLTKDQAQEVARDIQESLGPEWTATVRETLCGFQAVSIYIKNGVEWFVESSDWYWNRLRGCRNYTASLSNSWRHEVRWSEHGTTPKEAIEKTKESAVQSLKEDACLLGMDIKLTPKATRNVLT